MATTAVTQVNELADVNVVEEQDEVSGITLSAAAEAKLANLLMERNIPTYGLRVFVAGGGCSGLQYGMAFEQQARDFDTVFKQGGVQVFVDPTSLMYLAGASIDYVENLMGGGFKIENPNAVSACGCGQSFKTKDSGADSNDEAGCGSGCSCHH
jgi:iron-sulfur cluster assembly accessory protein